MTPTHWYIGVSGRMRLVTLTESKGKVWTNEPMPVLATSIDIAPIETLLGTKVSLGHNEGVVVGVLSDSQEYLDGKHRGNGVYFQRPDLTQWHHFVKIFWTKGLAPVWQPFFKLTITQ